MKAFPSKLYHVIQTFFKLKKHESHIAKLEQGIGQTEEKHCHVQEELLEGQSQLKILQLDCGAAEKLIKYHSMQVIALVQCMKMKLSIWNNISS